MPAESEQIGILLDTTSHPPPRTRIILFTKKKGGEMLHRHPDKCECLKWRGLEIKPRRKLDHPRIAAQYRGWIQKICSEWCHLIQSCQTRSTHRIHTIYRTRYILR